MHCSERWEGVYIANMNYLLFTHQQMIETLAEDLVTGDIVAIKQGDRVPAGLLVCFVLSQVIYRCCVDLRLIECVSLRIDESILTGEHKAVRKHPHALERYILLTNCIYRSFPATFSMIFFYS